MSNTLDFGVRSPDGEAVFWQSWITAGIALEPYKLAPGYTGMNISTQSQQGWTPTRLTGNMITDPMGNLVPERIAVSGWHANVRVYDPALIAMFTHGLDQTDENGVLKNLFDRTWAKEVFQLTEQPFDPVTGFPAGFRNSVGVTYADLTPGVTPFRSPTNRWA
jgi:hypothetical protein